MVMPAMGTSVSEGTVVAWSKGVGDAVEAGEAICDIATDKVDTECPAPAAGAIAEILVEQGETVEVGAVLARISPAGTPAVRSTTPAAPASSAAPARWSPVVARIAAHHDVDLSLVPGTGRHGRITKKDVLAWIESNGVAPPTELDRPLHSESPYRPDAAPPADAAESDAAAASPDDLGGVTRPLSRMRQSIATAMLRSQHTAATCHTVVECDMTHVERRRRELGLTALPLVARATIDALRDFTQLNATLDGTNVTRYERVHLGIAVSLGADGLIVPVIHDAQDLSAEGLGARVKELARRARAKRLTPDDVHGGTFTSTSPGQYGATLATPVINQPQVAILDREAIVKRPVVVSAAAGTDAIAIRPCANLVLGWDHRAVDGAYAAQFLTALRSRLETA